jgi:hypothetical protein
MPAPMPHDQRDGTTDLPAAVLARLLGIHIAAAVAWQRASAGDWAACAADISRRCPHLNDQPATHTHRHHACEPAEGTPP